MYYKGYYIQQASKDLIEKFIQYREKVVTETQDETLRIGTLETDDLFSRHAIYSRKGILVLNTENEIVGEMFVTSISPSSAAIITKFYVLKSERKKGVGTFLLRTIERVIALARCRAISVYRSENTYGFFYKLGYRSIPVKDASNFLVRDISDLFKTKCRSVKDLMLELERLQ